MNKLVEEHGHRVLCTPLYQCHFSHIEVVWSRAKRCYSSNIDRNVWNGSCEKCVEELLWQVCMFVFLCRRQSEVLELEVNGKVVHRLK
jgi:hypothetical protein